jgi:adenylate kinase
MLYQKKYLKYKSKYLDLKKNNLVGGTKSEVVFLLGGPGSGKGTVADRISKDFGYIQLTNSSVLKEEMDNEDADPILRCQIRESIANGKLLPPHISTALLRKKIISLGLGEKILVDGYPRSIEHLKAWINTNTDITNINFLLFLNCDSETLFQRAFNRGLQTGRADDNEITIRKRIDTYINKTLPVLEYSKTVCKVVNIDGNKSKEEVYEQVRHNFLKKSEVVFVMGGPGCGKGTISDRISKDFGYIPITNSTLLKKEMNNDSADPKLREQIRNAMTKGLLLPPEISIKLLRKEITELGLGKKILIDGFPRDTEQLNSFLKECSDIVNIKFILFLNCSPEIMLKRALERGVLTGRTDDTSEVIKNRIDIYTRVTTRVLDEAMLKGLSIKEINSNRPVDLVYQDVQQYFCF